MAKKLTPKKAREILHDKSVHGKPLTEKQRKFFGAIAGGAEPYKAQGGLSFLQPNNPKLPVGVNPRETVIPFKPATSTEYATSIGGEGGQPAYLIPGFKYGRPLSDPEGEFMRTGEYLGGPFKTWQEADEWERTVRHPYVEQGKPIPSPIRTKGKEYKKGGAVLKAQSGILTNDWERYKRYQDSLSRGLNPRVALQFTDAPIRPTPPPLIKKPPVKKKPPTRKPPLPPKQQTPPVITPPVEPVPRTPQQQVPLPPQPERLVKTKDDIFNFYGQGTPVYGPTAYGRGYSGQEAISQGVAGFRDKSGNVTYIKPEHYEVMGVNRTLREWIESQGKKEYGGAIPKAQSRGIIYTSNPNDPRLRAYQDSLALYNKWNSKGWREYLRLGEGVEISDIYRVPYNPKGETKNANNKVIPIGSENMLGTNWRNVVKESIKNKIKPLGWLYEDLAVPAYKKPVQPVKYKKPEQELPVVTITPENVPRTPSRYVPELIDVPRLPRVNTILPPTRMPGVNLTPPVLQLNLKPPVPQQGGGDEEDTRVPFGERFNEWRQRQKYKLEDWNMRRKSRKNAGRYDCVYTGTCEENDIPKAQTANSIKYKELPEVTIVGSKDKATMDFYRNEWDKILSEGSQNPSIDQEAMGKYLGYTNIGKEYGFPRVQPETKSGVYSHATGHYNPLTETIYANDIGTWLAEMSHHVQMKDDKIGKTLQWLTNDLPLYIKRPFIDLKHIFKYGPYTPLFNYSEEDLQQWYYSSPYNKEGTLENEAHSIIFPKLQEKIGEAIEKYTNKPSTGATKERYLREIERKQYGGDIPKAQTGLRGEATYSHVPKPTYHGTDAPAGDYMLRRTVTPYKTRRQIKKNVGVPSSPSEVNFISNYAGAIGSPLSEGFEWPTSVPYEGAKHWNIDRFIIDPQFGDTYPGLRNEESTKRQMKMNTLSDMYKYFMLQNQGDKKEAWKQAKKFMRTEVNPRVGGPVYDNYIRGPLGSIIPNITGLTSVVTPDYLTKYQNVKESVSSPFEDSFTEEFKKNPMSLRKVKQVGMDWLMNYKGMSRKEAREYLKSTENKKYGESIPKAQTARPTYEERPASDISQTVPRIRTNITYKPKTVQQDTILDPFASVRKYTPPAMAEEMARLQQKGQQEFKPLYSDVRRMGEQYRKQAERQQAIQNAPFTQSILMGAPGLVNEGQRQAAGAAAENVLQGTPFMSANRLVQAYSPNKDIYFRKGASLGEDALGALALAGDITNLTPYVRPFASNTLPIVRQGLGTALSVPDRYLTKVGRNLNYLQKEGKKQGLSDWEIKKQQMDLVGITSAQRRGYVPGISELAYKYITPFGYEGAEGNKLQEIFSNIKKGGVKYPSPENFQYGDTRLNFDLTVHPERADAWNIYLGMPQKYSTYEMASSMPLTTKYSPAQLKKMELFSFRPGTASYKDLSTNVYDVYGGPDLLYSGKPSTSKSPYVVGAYDRRWNKLGLEYMDEWDLDPPMSYTSLIPGDNRFKQKVLSSNLLGPLFKDGNNLKQFTIPVDKYFGKPFLSYGVTPPNPQTSLFREQQIQYLKNFVKESQRLNNLKELAWYEKLALKDKYNPEKTQEAKEALKNLRSMRKAGGPVKKAKGGMGVIADDGKDIVMPFDGPYASASDGYEGLGYSNQGYDYNSAWGGRWATGGMLPGMGGTMYARTGQDWQPKNISQTGGDIPVDPEGYRNPDNAGKPVIIPSNQITMEGMTSNVLGVSDTGDTKMMRPGEEYTFEGDSVLEIPVDDEQKTEQDKGQLKKLDQLTNFTNYNEMKKARSGIYIKPSKKGTFTAAATKRGKGVQEFASQVLANKEDYSPAMVKKANFARNAAKWKREDGGYIEPLYTQSMMAGGGNVPDNPGFKALPGYVQAKIMANMAAGGKMPADYARARFEAAGNEHLLSEYGYAYGGMVPPMGSGGKMPQDYAEARFKAAGMEHKLEDYGYQQAMYGADIEPFVYNGYNDTRGNWQDPGLKKKWAAQTGQTMYGFSKVRGAVPLDSTVKMQPAKYFRKDNTSRNASLGSKRLYESGGMMAMGGEFPCYECGGMIKAQDKGVIKAANNPGLINKLCGTALVSDENRDVVKEKGSGMSASAAANRNLKSYYQDWKMMGQPFEYYGLMEADKGMRRAYGPSKDSLMSARPDLFQGEFYDEATGKAKVGPDDKYNMAYKLYNLARTNPKGQYAKRYLQQFGRNPQELNVEQVATDLNTYGWQPAATWWTSGGMQDMNRYAPKKRGGGELTPLPGRFPTSNEDMYSLPGRMAGTPGDTTPLAGDYYPTYGKDMQPLRGRQWPVGEDERPLPSKKIKKAQTAPSTQLNEFDPYELQARMGVLGQDGSFQMDSNGNLVQNQGVTEWRPPMQSPNAGQQTIPSYSDYMKENLGIPFRRNVQVPYPIGRVPPLDYGLIKPETKTLPKPQPIDVNKVLGGRKPGDMFERELAKKQAADEASAEAAAAKAAEKRAERKYKNREIGKEVFNSGLGILGALASIKRDQPYFLYDDPRYGTYNADTTGEGTMALYESGGWIGNNTNAVNYPYKSGIKFQTAGEIEKEDKKVQELEPVTVTAKIGQKQKQMADEALRQESINARMHDYLNYNAYNNPIAKWSQKNYDKKYPYNPQFAPTPEQQAEYDQYLTSMTDQVLNEQINWLTERSKVSDKNIAKVAKDRLKILQRYADPNPENKKKMFVPSWYYKVNPKNLEKARVFASTIPVGLPYSTVALPGYDPNKVMSPYVASHELNHFLHFRAPQANLLYNYPFQPKKNDPLFTEGIATQEESGLPPDTYEWIKAPIEQIAIKQAINPYLDPKRTDYTAEEVETLMKQIENSPELKNMPNKASSLNTYSLPAEESERIRKGFPASQIMNLYKLYKKDPQKMADFINKVVKRESPKQDQTMAASGQMIKRKDGSYSRRGLWDNIRANRGSGRKPTAEMLRQERKIKAKEAGSGMGVTGMYYPRGGEISNVGNMRNPIARMGGSIRLNHPDSYQEGGELSLYDDTTGIQPLSNSPVSGPMIEFKGPDHGEKNNIGTEGTPINFEGTDVEVYGGEIATPTPDGNLQLFGQLNNPFVNGEETFEESARKVAEEERKQTKIAQDASAALATLDRSDKFSEAKARSYELKRDGAMQMLQSLDEYKKDMSALQEYMNDSADSEGVSAMKKWNKKKKLGGMVKAQTAPKTGGFWQGMMSGFTDSGFNERTQFNPNRVYTNYDSINRVRRAQEQLARTADYWAGKMGEIRPDTLRVMGPKPGDLPVDNADFYSSLRQGQHSANNTGNTSTQPTPTPKPTPAPKKNSSGKKSSTKKPVKTTDGSVDLRGLMPPRFYTEAMIKPEERPPADAPEVAPTWTEELVRRGFGPQYYVKPSDAIGSAGGYNPATASTKKKGSDEMNLPGFDYTQILPEVSTLLTESVDYLPFQRNYYEEAPLTQVSFQDRVNEVERMFRSASKAIGNNPAAQSQLAAEKATQLNALRGEEFRTNQMLRLQKIETDRIGRMQTRAAELQRLEENAKLNAVAKSLTRRNRQLALESLIGKKKADEAQKNAYKVMSQLFNYQFDENYRARYSGPSAFFDDVLLTMGADYKGRSLDKDGNPTKKTKTTTRKKPGDVTERTTEEEKSYGGGGGVGRNIMRDFKRYNF